LTRFASRFALVRETVFFSLPRRPSRRLLARETRAHKGPVTSSSIFLGEIQPKKWKQPFSSTVVAERTKTSLPPPAQKGKSDIPPKGERRGGEEITIKGREGERSAARNNSCVFYRAGECFLAILGGASGGCFSHDNARRRRPGRRNGAVMEIRRFTDGRVSVAIPISRFNTTFR